MNRSRFLTLIAGGKKKPFDPDRFVLLVDSEESGVSGSDQFEITGADVSTGTTFPVRFSPEADPFDFTDVTVDVSDPTITFPTAGRYFVQIGGAFNRIAFNEGGDKDKLLEIVQWGDLTWSSFGDAFHGCNLTKLPDGAMTGNFSEVTTFFRCFRNNNITSIPAGLFDNTTAVESFNRCFTNNSLTSIPAGLFDNTTAVTDFRFLFFGNSLTSIPAGLFDNTTQVTSFESCFQNNSLTSIPAGIFDNTTAVTNFNRCFTNNSLTSIPAGLFDNTTAVTNFSTCFRNNNLTSIPAGLFDNTTAVESFSNCFRDNNLTSIPAGLFDNNTLADRFDDCFDGNTLDTADLSRLYCELSVFNTNTNVPFHGGSGNYDPALNFTVDGQTINTGDARDVLAIDRGWTLTDGGAI